MNRIRRNRLAELTAKLEELQDELQSITEEEEEARDNMPESLWETDRYAAMDEACDNLNAALDSLQETMDYVVEAIG